MLSAEEINRLSAGEEAVPQELPQQTPTGRETYRESLAYFQQLGRPALQKSMDLREQGYADDTVAFGAN